MSAQNPVRSLNAEVARKIAAGEVIDRPNAIVRELLDNSIDAGAKNITVEISGGGIEKIRIIDDGSGMTKKDLQSCARPHATSKISTENDLMNLHTLGFRGEALASIAAVSRLSILSGGWKMRASITEDHIIEPAANNLGTIVQSEGLFENFPARRQFLKRPATEALLCKNTFIEKSLYRTDISFRFIQDGEIKLDLPAGHSLKERFVLANSYTEDIALFNEVKARSSHFTDEELDWEFDVVIGEPAVSRTNKKDIYIYVNGRRIQEYSLIQAIEYGGQGYFPNGTYPVAAAFIKMSPSLVDFNIHPAKKEARFYDISDLHHGLSSTLKSFFLKYTQKNFSEDKPADYAREFSFTNHINYKPSFSSHSSTETSDFRSRMLGLKVLEKTPAYREQKPQFMETNFTHTGTEASKNSEDIESLSQIALDAGLPEENFREKSELTSAIAKQSEVTKKIRFIGTCLGTFLLAEKGSALYFIDQHAVHERIIFDSIMNTQGKRQPLLIPYNIKTDSKTQDNQLEKLKDELTKIGFETKKLNDGEWEISSVPERWNGTEYDLRSLIFVKQVEPAQIIRSIAAMTACKAAVKDGYVLDDQTAAELCEKAFELEDPHCPHGRPIYTTISREQLFALVKRT